MGRMSFLDVPEGATPIDDCSGLIPNWVHTLDDLNRIEAENISFAQRKYLRKPVREPTNWFHVEELKKIHRIMFENVWIWAGSFRKEITSIGIRPYLIPTHLSQFCEEVVSWSQHPVELTFLEKAARIHHRLVFIHPFENGNGRFSRLISDRYLMANNCPHPIWPEKINHDGSERKNYIQSLQEADKGNYYSLTKLMQEFGARDPYLSEFLENASFRHWQKEEMAIMKVKALLRQGANPNDVFYKGQRPLQLAIKANLDSVVMCLIEEGAEIDCVDRSGLTPLQVAVSKENKKIAELLLSLGARK